jgi:hypothetical protein
MPVKKKIENLPRTGIEYPFLKHTVKFIEKHPEYEKLADIISPMKLEEYQQRELDKQPNLSTYPLVYDYCEYSPLYANKNNQN